MVHRISSLCSPLYTSPLLTAAIPSPPDGGLVAALTTFQLSPLMERVLCCALGVSMCVLAGCSHTTPIAKTRGTSIAPATKVPNRADLAARIQAVEAEAEQAKQSGDNTAALHAYRRLLVLDPAHADAHHHLAVAADMDQDFSVAERHYRAALEREPENPHLHTSLGWSLFLQHRDGEAVEELRRALELDPEHATALFNMGWLAAHRGDEAEAVEYFRRGGTEAQAQALLVKVRLELEDRTSRNETQRAVARLRAPSPRSRTPRIEESSESTIQARAEFEGEGPAQLPLTASLELAPAPVSEPLDVISFLEDKPEPRPVSATADQQELPTGHLAERPAIQTVSHEAVSQEHVTGESEVDESVVEAAVAELPTIGRADAELGEDVSERSSPSSQRPVPAARPSLRSSSAARMVTPPSTATEADTPEIAVDSGLRRGELAASPAEAWPAFSTRTLATVGRVMLGRPSAAHELGTPQERRVPSADSGLEDGTLPTIGTRTSAASRRRIEPEVLNAARMGLNLGQPATRRFHSPNRVADEPE